MASPPSPPILGMYLTNGAFPTPGPSAWPSGPTTNLSAQYMAWGQDWDTYGAAFITECYANGQLAFVELEPWHSGANWNVTPLFSDITGGQWDSWLTGIGTSIAAAGKTVILTFGHEMNVSGQYPWSQNAKETIGYTSGVGGNDLTPAQWIAGWKYVHDKINSTANGNVVWMWACSAWTGGSTVDPSPWWPGASYVDMVGIDGYPNNVPAYGPNLGTFSGQIQQTVTAIRNLGWTQPIFISETNLAQMVASGGESITSFVADMHTAGISGILEFEDAGWGLPAMSPDQWTEYNTAVAALYGSAPPPPPPPPVRPPSGGGTSAPDVNLGPLVVTATASGSASPGILLRVLALDGATVPATLNAASQSGAAQHAVRVTPAHSGSLVLSASVDFSPSLTAPSPAAGNTALDAVADNVSSGDQFYSYGTFKSASTVAGTALTVGSANADAGGVAALEVVKAGTAAITTDASSPASVSSVSIGSPLTSVATDSFSPPPGALLVALVSSAGDPYSVTSMTVTDSYGLTWTQAVAANATGQGYAGVWYAFAPTALSVSTTALPAGTVDLGYGSALAASGGYQGYTWSLASGRLPAGLSLFPDGTIRGVPTAAGSGTFTAAVTDAAGSKATSGSLTLTINSVASTGISEAGQWVGKADAYTYGTLAVPVTNAEHNWLFVAASWEDGQDVAVAFIADDAHNFYRDAFYTTSGTIRTQVWAVANARAAKNIYVSTSAYARWLTVSVHEIAGLGPQYSLDAIVTSPDDGPGNSLPMGVSLAHADFVFAAAAWSGAPVALSSSGTGATWHSLGSHSNGDSSTGVSQATAWGSNNSAVAAAVTFSSPHTHTYSGGVVAVRQAQPALHNDNRAWPVMWVEAAFGYPAGNPAGLPVWTDISDRFLGLSGQRGRDFELDELSAADLTLTLDNFDGALTPFNTRAGAYDVDLMTPVRVMGDWQGRRYFIAGGLITALPQTFDFQRGMIKVSMTDDYSKLPQVLLPSCMISELLYDDPLDLWPLNDAQGAKFASNWSGRSTAVLVPVHAKYGAGGSYNGAGSAPSINTGFGNSNASTYPGGFDGSTDSVWGNASSIVSKKVDAVLGTALAARDYSGLPMKRTGATYEVWALLANESTNWSTGATLISVGDDKGANGGGDFLTLGIPAGPVNGSTYTGGAQVIVVAQGNLSSNATHSFKAPVNPYTGSVWHHYALTVETSGRVSVYMDGTLAGQFAGKFPHGTPNWISFGGDPKLPPVPVVGGTSKGIPKVAKVAGLFTGMLANAVVYDRVLDAERIAAHFKSGATGFVGDYAGQRISRFLTYARWAAPQAIERGSSKQQQINYLAGGYASSGLSGAIGQFSTTGGGWSDQGAQVDITVQDVAAGELGFLFVAADGTLTFKQRSGRYNQAATGILGDMDFALNQTDFKDWLSLGGANCTVSLSSSWSLAGGESALLTVLGQAPSAHPHARAVNVKPGDTLGASAWVMSPQGAWVYLAIDYRSASDPSNIMTSTLGASQWCPPLTPVQLGLKQAAVPAGAATAELHPVIDKTPAAGVQLYCDRVRLSPAGLQVPYEDDVEITTDVQYLYNDVVITRNYDNATYRATDKASRDKYYPRVFTRTIYTDLADAEAVVDVANWLVTDYATPRLRVSKVTVNCSNNPEAWNFCLKTDIGDLVGFERNPVGADQQFGTFRVLSVEIDIERDKAQFSYILAPATGTGVLTLDDPVFGVPGMRLAF